jgi:Uma2 family endonuclease
MDAIVLDRNGLLAAWHKLVPTADGVVRDRYEMNEFGEVVASCCPSGARQLAFTDIYCQLTDQIGHLAAMSVPVVTPSLGIRIPDVVWMAPENGKSSTAMDLCRLSPDLCVEVLLDSDRPRELGRRAAAYFEGGAKEVFVVTPGGLIEFWGADGRRQASTFAVTLSPEAFYCKGSAPATTPGEQLRGNSPQRAAEMVVARDARMYVGTAGVAAGSR